MNGKETEKSRQWTKLLAFSRKILELRFLSFLLYSYAVVFGVLFFLLFWSRVSHIPGQPQPCYAGKPWTTDCPASTSQVLGLQANSTMLDFSAADNKHRTSCKLRQPSAAKPDSPLCFYALHTIVLFYNEEETKQIADLLLFRTVLWDEPLYLQESSRA